MPEYVDREAIKKYPIRLNHYDKKNGNYHFVLGIESVMEYVDDLPIADVQEVKHGKWLDTDSFDNHKLPIYQCSVCLKTVADTYIKSHKYCLHCGARMDKE